MQGFRRWGFGLMHRRLRDGLHMLNDRLWLGGHIFVDIAGGAWLGFHRLPRDGCSRLYAFLGRSQ